MAGPQEHWEQVRRKVGHPLLASVREPLTLLLEHFPHFPRVEELDEVFAERTGVHFVVQPPKPRRAQPKPADQRYDGQIAVHRQVPTRPGSLHDLLNALVWAAFPQSKMRLHRRQYQAQGQRGEMAGHWVRTREQDAYSMLDEGGLLMQTAEPEEVIRRLWAGEVWGEELVMFGHALAEHVVEERGIWGMVLVLPADGSPEESLARQLDDPAFLREPVPWPAARVGPSRSKNVPPCI